MSNQINIFIFFQLQKLTCHHVLWKACHFDVLEKNLLGVVKFPWNRLKTDNAIRFVLTDKQCDVVVGYCVVHVENVLHVVTALILVDGKGTFGLVPATIVMVWAHGNMGLAFWDGLPLVVGACWRMFAAHDVVVDVLVNVFQFMRTIL